MITTRQLLRVLRLFCAGIALGALVSCDKPKHPAAAPGIAHSAIDSAALAQWADETFGRILAEKRVSALAIAVTQGEGVVFKRGYGWETWGSEAVNPDTSQFRIASLSKTFVGTAIAQLLERGQIVSLDDPVNKYLKRVQLKDWNGKAVTIWDMMTHQGGLGPSPVFADNENDPPHPPLPSDYIAARMPDLVREPGTFSNYCNPCTATLGFMIEDISGQTLQDYMEANIFQPLGMTHTVVETAPHPSSQDIVTQYAFVPGGGPVALPYPAITPFLAYAGTINSTAGDMAKWLIAHNMAGQGSGPKILKPETFKLMHSRHRGNEPTTSGFGMQFFTYDYSGEHVLEHYGSLNFYSMEFFMLDSKVGVFVTFAGGGEAAPEVVKTADAALPPVEGPVNPRMSHSGVRALVLEHFLGKLPVDRNLKADVAKFVGAYRSIGSSGQGRPLEVKDSGDGGLVIGDIPGVYRPSGPNTFTLDGPLPLEAGFRDSNKFVFVSGENGTMRMFAHVNAGGFERASAP